MAPPPDPIPGLIPGGDISLLAGAPGTGKTALYSEWITRIMNGRSILGHMPGKVSAIGVVFTDRQWQTSRHWLDVAGVPLEVTAEEVEAKLAKEVVEGVPHYCIKDDDSFQWSKMRVAAQHLKLLTGAVEVLWGGLPPEGSLIIIDPISPFFGARLNDYSSVAAAVGPISQWCARNKVTILGTHHTSKLKSDKKDRYVRPQDRILGSTALTGYTNTQFFVVAPEETEKPWHLVGYATHNIPSAEFKFTKNEKGLFVPYTAKDADTMRSPGEIDKGTKRLVELLPRGGKTFQTLRLINMMRAEAGWSVRTTERKLKELRDQGVAVQPAKGRWGRGEK